MKMRVIQISLILAALAAVTVVASYGMSSSKEETITLNNRNQVRLVTEVSQSSVSQLITEIDRLNNPEVLNTPALGVSINDQSPIYLFLRTPGGDVQAGMELIEAIKGSRRQINTITMFSASMGFQIVQNLGTRYVLDSGILMSHHAKGMFQGEMGGRGKSQAGTRLALWESLITKLDLQTVARTNGKQTLSSYQDAYDHELWAIGEDAVKLGYADATVTVQCDSSLAGESTFSTALETPFGPISVQYEAANCPLNSSPKNVRSVGQVLDSKTKVAAQVAIDEFKSQYVDIQNHILPMVY